MPSSRVRVPSLHAHLLDRRQQADQPLDREVLGGHRHDQRVRGHDRVDADQ